MSTETDVHDSRLLFMYTLSFSDLMLVELGKQCTFFVNLCFHPLKLSEGGVCLMYDAVSIWLVAKSFM